MQNQFLTKDAVFWMDTRDIIFCRSINDNTYHEISIETAQKYEGIISTLTKDRPMPILIDIRNSNLTYNSLTAKLFANSPVIKNRLISQAFVINSLRIKLLIYAYKRIYEPNTKFKIFNDLDNAIAYCIENNINYTNN